MLESLEWLGYVIAVLLAVPVMVLSVELLAALLPAKLIELQSKRPSVAVLIPAHDEEHGLAATLHRIREQLTANDRLLVVADNCSDATAEVARAAGAEVVERFNPDQRGKGFALASGVEWLSDDPRPVLVVIDADSEIQPGAIDALGRTVAATGRPAQAINLLEAPVNSGPAGRLAAFAFFVKNVARPRGLSRLGLPCLLYGTGMALPWKAVGAISFAGGDITEDIRIASELALKGFPTVFCPHPGVSGRFPESRSASQQQRNRWEHGHLSNLGRQVPRLIGLGLASGRPCLIGVGIHLGVPPLALLFLICTAAMAGLALLGWYTPAAAIAAALGIAAVALGLVWLRFGRRIIGFRDLLLVPWYAVGKLAIYGRFLWRPERHWVRTERNSGSPEN